MHETTDATAIFAPIWRRKWMILAVGLIVGAASYLYYKHATPTYRASTQVYLGATAEEPAPGEKTTKLSSSVIGDQAAIINSIVVEEVHRRLREDGKGELVRNTKVKAKNPEKSQFISITAEGHTGKGTVLLTNLVAHAYVTRRNRSRERAINRAIAIARRQLERIEAAQAPVPAKGSSSAGKGKGGSSGGASSSGIIQAADLSSKINQLESSLAVSGAQLVKPAVHAQLVAPQPRKDAIFGFVIGVVLSAIAAYALGRLDRRLRTLEGIEAIFGAQTLTALPKVNRPIVKRVDQPAPSRFLLEPLRRLHTTLELQRNGVTPGATGRGRALLALSSDPGDGKSTLVADLALVARDGGARVAIVEANFRRPAQARLLGLDGTRGLAEVLAGTLTIEDATQRLVSVSAVDDATRPEEQPAPGAVTAVATRGAGSLFLLSGSRTVANPPALLADPGIGELLQSLRDEFDYVLIDAPSPLEFSDVMPLLGQVDGIVLVARAGHTRELSAQRFMQLLANSPTAPVLGTVANCVSKGDIAQQGLSASGGRTWLGKLTGS
jgi:polysaccharide biosynthesis transport protein